MKKWLVGLLVLWVLLVTTNSASASPNPSQPTSDVGLGRSSQLSGKIALTITTNNPPGSGWQDSQRDIFLLDLATGSLTNITHSRDEEMMPRISPDGKEMLFGAFDGNSFWQVRRYSFLNKSSQAALPFNDLALPLAWLPDDRFLVEVGGLGDFEIHLVDKKTRSHFRLTQVPSMPAPASCSPDGRRIAFEYENLDRIPKEAEDPCELPGIFEIRILDLVTSQITYLLDGQNPDWSPNGKLLAFENPEGVFLFNFETLAKTQIGPKGAFSPVFSPDGQYLACLEMKKRKAHVLIISLATRNVIKRIPVGAAQGMDW